MFLAQLGNALVNLFKSQRLYSPVHFSEWMTCDELALCDSFPARVTRKKDVEARLGPPHLVINKGGEFQWNYHVAEYWIPLCSPDVCTLDSIRYTLRFNFDEKHYLKAVQRELVTDWR